jgi:hypothetical protein
VQSDQNVSERLLLVNPRSSGVRNRDASPPTGNFAEMTKFDILPLIDREESRKVLTFILNGLSNEDEVSMVRKCVGKYQMFRKSKVDSKALL